MYTKKVKDHFQNPRNFGKIKDADSIGEVGNMACGDVMKLYLKIKKSDKGDEIISDIKFETFGCAAAIATSSKITEMAKGKALTEALQIDDKAIIESLNGLPQIKVHCSVLAAKALSEAIYNYYKKNNVEITESLEKKHQLIVNNKEK